MKMLLERMLRKTIICQCCKRQKKFKLQPIFLAQELLETKVKKWYLLVFIVPIVSIVSFLRILENGYLVLDLKLGISSHILSQQFLLIGHMALCLPHVDS